MTILQDSREWNLGRQPCSVVDHQIIAIPSSKIPSLSASRKLITLEFDPLDSLQQEALKSKIKMRLSILIALICSIKSRGPDKIRIA